MNCLNNNTGVGILTAHMICSILLSETVTQLNANNPARFLYLMNSFSSFSRDEN